MGRAGHVPRGDHPIQQQGSLRWTPLYHVAVAIAALLSWPCSKMSQIPRCWQQPVGSTGREGPWAGEAELARAARQLQSHCRGMELGAEG